MALRIRPDSVWERPCEKLLKSSPEVFPGSLQAMFTVASHLSGGTHPVASGWRWLCLVGLVLVGHDCLNAQRLLPPAHGLYHAAFPDFGGTEDQVSAARISDFETLAGKEITWAYFSNNWLTTIEFPSVAVAEILSAGRLPFIRLMARSSFDDPPDPVYSLQRFLDGDFDAQLHTWARAAANVEAPLLVEFGTEVNGDWFGWNGRWNGAGQTTGYGDPTQFDGQERFRDTYRRIVDIFRAEGADNVTWFFHADCSGSPNQPWNSISGYYPGDEYVDWIGISCYGPQDPTEGWWTLTEVLDPAYPEFAGLSPTKPMALLEFAVLDAPTLGSKAQWITEAIDAVRTGRYPRVRAISWWHENFGSSNLRIDTSPAALAAYRQAVAPSALKTVPRFGLFADGFESGDTGGWSSTVP